MVNFLDIDCLDFEEQFMSILNAKQEASDELNQIVSSILSEVKSRGDGALIDYSKKFDRISLKPATIKMSTSEIKEAAARVSSSVRHALEFSAHRIRSYHEKQIPDAISWTDDIGVELGWRWSPISSVGLYVPGGRASYPSTLLMNAIPAKIAGVKRLAITVPTPDGEINSEVMAAAQIAGIDEIYRLGGAQAVAAMAYGSQSVKAVDKIMGPGNAYVAAAKRQVFGHVGIDLIAGPSEILVIADEENDPDWIACDLLSQAEHDEFAQSILITDSAGFGKSVMIAVDCQLTELRRKEIASASWRNFGKVILVRDLQQAAKLSNQIAPEHLQLCVKDPDSLAKLCTNAGAIFLGQWTPEAIGDYVAGPNHVLPTARSARFSSGLSVMDFLKRTTITRMNPKSFGTIGPFAEKLALSEGLQAHALSVQARLRKLNR
ncbi:MAG: histidinol dehydrogenase [Aestuariivita sp.]|nr:histidinol dehydrogenase [Aestuariivita sp.]